MSVSIDCDKCNVDIDNDHTVFCERCFVEMEDKITALETEIENLKGYLKEAEEEIDLMK